MDASDNILADMRNKAAHLPDGTAIFRDSVTGDIYTENGRHLATDEILNVQIPDDASTWNDYQTNVKNNQRLHVHKEQIQSDQAKLIAPIRQRLNDPDNPPSEDELNEMLTELDRMEKAHKIIIEEISNIPQEPKINTASAAKDIIGESVIKAPSVCDVFNSVKSDNACQAVSTPNKPENKNDTVQFDIPDL